MSLGITEKYDLPEYRAGATEGRPLAATMRDTVGALML
jgi:hypothetical protein